MPLYVGLVRGINVGSAKQIAMPALKAAFESWGYTDVRTLLRSGNVVFRSEAPLTEDAVRTIEKDFAGVAGFEARWMVFDSPQLTLITEENPLAGRPDPSRSVVGFVPWGADLSGITAPDAEQLAPEEFVVGKRAVYQWCPDGLSKSIIKPGFWKQFGDIPVTIRNLNTVTKLQQMLAE